FSGMGVSGSVAASSRLDIGVYGTCDDAVNDYAAYFDGDIYINGDLAKASGSFLIDHPDDPMNKTLRHNFVESPENLCLYRGKTKLDNEGKTTVEMPDYFVSLTKENEATVNLTPVGRPFMFGYEWNKDFTEFTIYGDPGREISYIVLADRDDPVIHHLSRPVVEEKGEGSRFPRGKLLNPEAYGYSDEYNVIQTPKNNSVKEIPTEPVSITRTERTQQPKSEIVTDQKDVKSNIEKADNIK
ncbi:MAG: hypothetical protein ACP5G4_12320, partial [bacterium]